MYYYCEACGRDTEHEVVKQRGSEFLVKCSACGLVHLTIEKPRLKEVSVIISRYEKSERKMILFPEEDEVGVGDEVEVGGEPARVTAINTEDGRKVEKAKLSDVKTLWCISLAMPVKVKYSLHFRGITTTGEIYTTRDRVFSIGEVVVTPEETFTIEKIKTKARMLKRGSARAEEIVRIYGRKKLRR
ncbi:HVO_0476 family zinc finger protein [Candidatus Pyrohabitans sp.]